LLQNELRAMRNAAKAKAGIGAEVKFMRMETGESWARMGSLFGVHGRDGLWS
jgi:hypothetical protein